MKTTQLRQAITQLRKSEWKAMMLQIIEFSMPDTVQQLINNKEAISSQVSSTVLSIKARLILLAVEQLSSDQQTSIMVYLGCLYMEDVRETLQRGQQQQASRVIASNQPAIEPHQYRPLAVAS